jgi:hypothetical protein
MDNTQKIVRLMSESMIYKKSVCIDFTKQWNEEKITELGRFQDGD